MLHQTTVAELERWRDHGATWRLIELTADHVEVDLCTCYGEPVDRVHSEDPDVVNFLREHPEAEL